MTELWDAYDAGFNKIEGITLVRGEELPDGIFHLVCEIAVKHKDGQYLLMQRDLKRHFGELITHRMQKFLAIADENE